MLTYIIEAIGLAFVVGAICGILLGTQMASQRMKLKPAKQKISRDR